MDPVKIKVNQIKTTKAQSAIFSRLQCLTFISEYMEHVYKHFQIKD